MSADGVAAKPAREQEEFPEQVRSMFDRIAGVYDLMNSAMTVGLHHEWRRRAVDRLWVAPETRALDLCCGTGDLSLELARRIGRDGSVVGSDFSENMLDLARAKAGGAGGAKLRFEWGDAMNLSYDDASFDVVSNGFGLRNLADHQAGIEEMARVLKPGGRMVVLEMTVPQKPPLSTFFALWFDRIVPRLGVLAGDSDAYTYLPESVKRFPGADTLGSMIAEAGFEQVRWLILAGGIIAIHSGVKRG